MLDQTDEGFISSRLLQEAGGLIGSAGPQAGFWLQFGHNLFWQLRMNLQRIQMKPQLVSADLCLQNCKPLIS